MLPGISDHDMIFAKVVMPHYEFTNTKPKTKSGQSKYNFKKADYVEIARLFSTLFLQMTEEI